MARSSPFNVINFLVTEFTEFSEKHLGKTPMNEGKSSQLGKQGFGSLHNLTWTCYHNEDFLLRH